MSTAVSLDFNQQFVLAPIDTHDAQIICDIMDNSDGPRKRKVGFLYSLNEKLITHSNI